MMMNKVGAKKKVLDELMGYLDQKDGEELGSVLKPKGDAVEVEALESETPEDAEMEVVASDGGAEMSPEELEELIEALQSKVGA